VLSPALGTASAAPRRTAGAGERGECPIVNLGLTKSGSSSLFTAVQWSGLGGVGSSRCSKWVASPLSVQAGYKAALASIEAGTAAEDSPLRAILRECAQLGDNPWWSLAPALLRDYPRARFVLTGFGSGPSGDGGWEAGCAAWANSSARGLWACRGKLDDIHTRWAGSRTFDVGTFARRCAAHHADVVATARRLGRRLLLLPIDWGDGAKGGRSTLSSARAPTRSRPAGARTATHSPTCRR